MCDYSLHEVASRPAKVGDKLVTAQFRRTITRGFAAVGEPNVAVCLLPGTEIAFDAEVVRDYDPLRIMFLKVRSWFAKKQQPWKLRHKVGRFRQVDMDKPDTHHDTIEFPDGQTVLLTALKAGQRATVLQLPVKSQGALHASLEANTSERVRGGAGR
jgi:hypothetical protein